MKKKKKKVTTLKVPEKRYPEELASFEKGLPSSAEISQLSMLKLARLRNQCIELWDQGEWLYYSINQIEKAPRIKALFKSFNKQIFEACFRPTFFKRESKAHQKVFTWTFENGETVPLNLDLELTMAGIKHVLKQYKDSTIGLSCVLDINEKGVVKMINVSDTVDVEHFFECITPKIVKNRKGGSPQLSATVLDVGTVTEGTDGQNYVVEKYAKGQRWCLED